MILELLFGKKEDKPKENIIFAKRAATNISETHNIVYKKREPNFDKIAAAFEEDKPETICMDDYSMNDIIDKAETIDTFLDYDYEFEPVDAKYIEDKLNSIYKELSDLANLVEEKAIEV